MKKILLTFLLITITPISTFAYTYSATDKNGKVLINEECTISASGRHFNCYDKISGKSYNRDNYQHKTQDIYINGQYKRINIDQIGDRTYIRY